MDDKSIVELFFERSEQGISEVRKKYGKKLLRIAGNAGLDYSDAEEVENETYYTAWNRIPPADPGDYLFSFLAKITREKAIDCVRRDNRLKRKRELLELGEEMELCIPAPNDVESEITSKELSEMIGSFLRTQSLEKRQVFLRRYWYMDSLSDIGKRFGLSEAKVKSILFRTRNELRKFLLDGGYEV